MILFRITRLLLLVSFIAWSAVSGGLWAQELPKPTSIYSVKTETGVKITLDYTISPYGAGVVFLVGETGASPSPLPSLDEQGKFLDQLLGELLQQHPDLPAKFLFNIGATKEDLCNRLVKKLQEPGSNWDAEHGHPRKGTFRDVLMAQLSEVIQASPIAMALEKHGYGLKLERIGRIEMQTINGKKFPTYIYTMEMTATKREKL
jgi:hypothetical protein